MKSACTMVQKHIASCMPAVAKHQDQKKKNQTTKKPPSPHTANFPLQLPYLGI